MAGREGGSFKIDEISGVCGNDTTGHPLCHVNLRVFWAILFLAFPQPASCCNRCHQILCLDLAPFLPLWWVLLFLWAANLIFRHPPGIAPAATWVPLPLLGIALILFFTRVPLALVAFALVCVLFILYLLILILRSRNRAPEERNNIRRHLRLQSILILLAFLLAAVTLLLYYQPEVLVYRLKWPVSFAVEERLLNGDGRTTRALVFALESRHDPEEIEMALRILGTRKDKEAAWQILRTLANSTDSEVKTAALDALGEIGAREALPFVIEMLIDMEKSRLSGLEVNPDSFSSSLTAVGKIDRQEAKRLLVAHAGKSREDRAVCAVLLAWLGDPEAVDEIRLLLREKSPPKRIAALEALAHIRASATEEIITGCLKDPEPAIRKRAVELLLSDNRKSHAGQLIALLRDENALVRSTANWALINLTGENFGFHPQGPEHEREKAIKKWENWWKKQGSSL